ncbi:MAG: nucleoside-diphosphate kinase [Actinobacteria bacterium]|nr:nucleoside-diphosphate kinase [Actinomycetota bacterium]
MKNSTGAYAADGGVRSSSRESDDIERSLVIIKPDAVRKNIVGEIISRFEKEGLVIEDLKMMRITRELACQHYFEHQNKDFFGKLVEYICSDRVVVMIIKGRDAIRRVRRLMGPTDPKKAEKGTIRGDFGTDITVNAIHGSDCKESAEREIKLFFG